MSLKGYFAPTGLLTHCDLGERRMHELINDERHNSRCSDITVKGDQIKEDEIGEIRSTQRGDMICVQNFRRKI